MSAAVLREAAALMRERAEAATPGPWSEWAVRMPSGDVYHAIGNDATEREVCSLARNAQGSMDSWHLHAWHPAVALAVADWLDREAEIWDAVLVRATQYAPKVEITIGLSTHEQALAVATTYLGRTAP